MEAAARYRKRYLDEQARRSHRSQQRSARRRGQLGQWYVHQSQRKDRRSSHPFLTGKPYAVALTEDLPETITTFRYYAGWADKIFGQTIGTTHQKFAYTLRQPIGVVAQIIPWNYPLSMAAWK
jgi:acyl-CoA reductase-like NAD-dependent aldehyde dehydrogenase